MASTRKPFRSVRLQEEVGKSSVTGGGATGMASTRPHSLCTLLWDTQPAWWERVRLRTEDAGRGPHWGNEGRGR